jgi:hypothetical protein
MNSFVETNLEPRKEWATPELKKIDVEQITAAGFTNASADLNGYS